MCVYAVCLFACLLACYMMKGFLNIKQKLTQHPFFLFISVVVLGLRQNKQLPKSLRLNRSSDNNNNNNNNANTKNSTDTATTSSSSSSSSSGYRHRMSLFGAPPYGGSIVQPLYYVDFDFCTTPLPLLSQQDKDDKTTMTTTMTTTTTTTTTTMHFYPVPPFSLGTPFFLLINRGGCTFVKKVCFFFLVVVCIAHRQHTHTHTHNSQNYFWFCATIFSVFVCLFLFWAVGDVKSITPLLYIWMLLL